MTQPCPPPALYWLPPVGDFSGDLAAARDDSEDGTELRERLTALAGRRLDFTQTLRLDRVAAAAADRMPAAMPRMRLALMASATLDHLAPGIRVAALRRGLMAEIMIAPYGQLQQQILDPESSLYDFGPDAVLLSIDGGGLLPELPLTATPVEADAAVDGAVDAVTALWRTLQNRARATVIQQVPWSEPPSLFGHLERQVPAAPAALAARLGTRLADAAASTTGVVLLDFRQAAASLGTHRLGDPTLWHHAKQSIAPAAVPWAGDHVARILAALRGLSKKVLVLDLDNTIWGGVIGDDGIDGIVLGPGSAAGEAYADFQRYAKRLAERGVLLALSSKNDPAIVGAALDGHPEMVLRRGDFAAMEIGWGDKPAALRRIAEDLELGLDSLVFVDDNPAERELVRRTLPAVSVPELPEAPELYAQCLADAGYFEAVSFTADDAKRNTQYVANRERRRLKASATDLDSFLKDLEMMLTVGPFEPADVARITQLINKTNQFNLTTRRYTEPEVRAMMDDPSVLTFAARLSDRFGDNGLTSIVIGRKIADRDGPAIELDNWLMSCRVLGRRVEHALLTVVAEKARAAGAGKLIGRYRPTARNGLVKDLYPQLGFELLEADQETGQTAWSLPLATARLPDTGHLSIVRRE